MSQETHQYSRHVKMAGYLQKWSISLILRNLQETNAVDNSLTFFIISLVWCKVTT